MFQERLMYENRTQKTIAVSDAVFYPAGKALFFLRIFQWYWLKSKSQVNLSYVPEFSNQQDLQYY